MKKKGIKAWLASLHPVLKELLAGIVLTGILFEAVFVWLAKDRLYFSAGLWLGIAVSIFRICHLYHGIGKSMEMSEKQAKGYADRNANRPFYFLHNPAHLLHLPIRQPFARCDDGITEYSPFLIALCLRNDLLFWQQRVLCGAGMVMRGLRAKPAIFRAAPALPVDNRADIKPVAAKMSPDSIRAFTQFVQWLLVKAHRFHLCDRFAA